MRFDMDPNITLKFLVAAIKNNDSDEVVEYSEALKDWLRVGGFEPSWLGITKDEFLKL